MEQDDLNIEITAVCDIFDVYGEAAVLTGSNIHREGSDGKFGPASETLPDLSRVGNGSGCGCRYYRWSGPLA